MSDMRDTLILPCRHLCLCSHCAESLRYQASSCPICRSPFRALLQVRAMRKKQSVPVHQVSDINDQTLQCFRISSGSKFLMPNFQIDNPDFLSQIKTKKCFKKSSAKGNPGFKYEKTYTDVTHLNVGHDSNSQFKIHTCIKCNDIVDQSLTNQIQFNTPIILLNLKSSYQDNYLVHFGFIIDI